jgi:CubicO group peptidase (beta-lactamase class C family)
VRTPFSLLLVCSLTALAHGQAPAEAGAQDRDFDTAWRGVTKRLKERVEKHGIVGASLAFVHRGKLIAQWQHGFADLDTKRKVDQDTIYHWASITKTFTGIAVMQLRDRGKVSLDDPIVRYLPELRKVHNPHGDMQDITLAHLMSHSAGFRGPTWPWGGQNKTAWHPHEPTRWEQIVAMLPYTEVKFRPGSRYSYSNLGIICLGRVIEITSGEDFEVYMEKNVLRPLGMRSSYFDHTPYHLLQNRSNNYQLKNGKPVANGIDFDTGITVSNGGLNGSLPDMARYLGFLCGYGDKTALSVLQRKSLAEMWRPRHAVGMGRDTKRSMGLTFFVVEGNKAKGKQRFIGHTGGQKAFVTFIYFRPENGTGAIAAFNTVPNRAVGGLATDLFDNVFPLFPDA